MPRFRISRRESRAEHWTGEMAAADSGAEALEAAWSWLKKELSEVAEDRPQKADDARWDMARQIADYAAHLPRHKVPHNPGLTERQRWELLHPWDDWEARR
jgi:hypothetical protein